MDASIDARQDDSLSPATIPDAGPVQGPIPVPALGPEAVPGPSRVDAVLPADVPALTGQSTENPRPAQSQVSKNVSDKLDGAKDRPSGNPAEFTKALEERRKLFRERISHTQVIQDVSEPFKRDVDLLPIESAQIHQWIERLQKYRIIVLQSEAHPFLISAAWHIFESSFSKCEARTWTFDESVANASVSGILTAMKTVGKSSNLIIVCAYQGSSQEFLGSLPVDPHLKLKRELEKKNAWMLVLTTPRLLQSQDTADCDYVEEPVPWLEPVLRSVMPERGAEYAHEIQNLSSTNPWPYTWRDTKRFALSGKLPETIERLHHGSGVRSNTRNGSELLNDQPLETAIKFVACYFGGSGDGETIAPEDFQRVLRTILADQLIEESVEAFSEQGNAITKQVKRKLVDIWTANSQRLAAKCGVSIFRDSGEVPYLDFVNPEQREAILTSFETDHVWEFDDLCQRVQDAALIFDSKRSVRAGAAKLILRKIASDPRGFGRTFLDDLTKSLPRPFDRQTKTGVIDLIDALVSRNLVDPVKSSLLYLMDSGKHREAWHLTLRLRTTPAFRPVFSLLFRRAIDEGNVQLRSDARDLALGWVEQTSSSSVPAVAEILSWALDERAAANAPSRLFAFDVAFNLLAAFPFPSTSLAADRRTVNPPEWFELLSKCLLNDGIDECFAPLTLGGALFSVLVPWMLAIQEYDDNTPGPVQAVAYACWTDELMRLPIVIEAQDLSNYFRAIVATEWGRLALEIPQGESNPVAVLRRLLTDKHKRRALRDNIQILADAAGAGYCAVDREKWEGTKERELRHALKKRLREIREAARYTKMALSE